MTHARLETGRRAEDLCADRLTALGWRVLARNWRIRAGELDLVARDRSTLVFVEVKATHAANETGPVAPALAVGPQKQRRIRRLASGWLAGPGRRLRFTDVRFDVVGVTFGPGGELVDYDHIENAF